MCLGCVRDTEWGSEGQTHEVGPEWGKGGQTHEEGQRAEPR